MIIRATVTGKNQITIPAVVTRALHIEPGMQLEFELGEERTVLVRPVLSRAERVKQLEEKWQPLFPPGSDPIGDLIRERELIDEEID
ncbi:MAG TPA: AbrB/MazE/SpoVT family DNA-binding domain-containing protein [Promineifilum sp.]|nr:AbrB/MazE/SpoVT family DNA-binding domain-containing protein [Promineifilum sp.]HRQ13605.1 AbrB/MazE/SpoVT family DNA-binding domain-containing protein [Promineifilum sp.]